MQPGTHTHVHILTPYTHPLRTCGHTGTRITHRSRDHTHQAQVSRVCLFDFKEEVLTWTLSAVSAHCLRHSVISRATQSLTGKWDIHDPSIPGLMRRGSAMRAGQASVLDLHPYSTAHPTHSSASRSPCHLWCLPPSSGPFFSTAASVRL